MSKVYQPTFLALAARSAWKDYARIARAIVIVTGIATAGAIGLEILGLEALFGLVFNDRFTGAEPLVIILTVSFFFVGGLHIWIWPLLLSRGRIGQFTGYSIVAVVFGQYGAALLLFYGLSPATIWFAFGYVLSDMLLYALVLLHLRRRHHEFLKTWALKD
jgi:O-antigen/teichoic acid export membrane protein